MARWVPDYDLPAPDDSHVWLRPLPDDCPDCDCCSERLCRQATERHLSCVDIVGSGDMDVSQCPCSTKTGQRHRSPDQG